MIFTLWQDRVDCVKRTLGTRRYAAHTLLILLCCFLTITHFGGCRNQGPERVVVVGTVTYNGKPVSQGMMRFVPDQTSTGPTAGAIIANGSYKADGHGGVPVGTHTIQIEAYRKMSTPPPTNMPRIPGEPQEQYLPRKFNVNSNLEITIQSGSPVITKNFDLTD